MRRHLVALALLAGCVPHVYTTVMQAADVDAPGRRLRVVDRTAPPSGASAAATRGLHERLGGSCTDRCDGTVELVWLRYEEQVEAAPEGEGYAATRLARVVTEWRLLDAEGALREALAGVGTLDRWVSRAATESAAREGLPAQDVSARDLAYSTGVAYGHRLFSDSFTYRRTYYAAGPLRPGAIALRAGAPEEAIRQWTGVARSDPRRRIAARAHHDLAVAYELLGTSSLAREHVDVALSLGAPTRTRRYADVLARSRGVTRPLRQFHDVPEGGSSGDVGAGTRGD